jgi:hypothetical protein
MGQQTVPFTIEEGIMGHETGSYPANAGRMVPDSGRSTTKGPNSASETALSGGIAGIMAHELAFITDYSTSIGPEAASNINNQWIVSLRNPY